MTGWEILLIIGSYIVGATAMTYIVSYLGWRDDNIILATVFWPLSLMAFMAFLSCYVFLVLPCAAANKLAEKHRGDK